MNPDHAWIEAHIPHQGRMCLLDAVLDWDADQLRACAHSHRSCDNPLRVQGRLGVVCGIEYAAQAVAVHAALQHGRPAPGAYGMLASARALHCAVERLDDIEQELAIRVQRLQSGPSSALYEFALHADTRPLLHGRLSLLLSAGNSAPI